MSALEKAEQVLADTERHPDAPSTVPLYLRALLELVVAREQRDVVVRITNNYVGPSPV